MRSFHIRSLSMTPVRRFSGKNVVLKSVVVNGASVDVLMITLKGPKEAKGSSVKVDLFANNTKSCPVRAYKKLISFWGHGED